MIHQPLHWLPHFTQMSAKYTQTLTVYTADPRFVKNAYKLDDISYDEMLELASLGANVLHNRSVEMAKSTGLSFQSDQV